MATRRSGAVVMTVAGCRHVAHRGSGREPTLCSVPGESSSGVRAVHRARLIGSTPHHRQTSVCKLPPRRRRKGGALSDRLCGGRSDRVSEPPDWIRCHVREAIMTRPTAFCIRQTRARDIVAAIIANRLGLFHRIAMRRCAQSRMPPGARRSPDRCLHVAARSLSVRPSVFVSPDARLVKGGGRRPPGVGPAFVEDRSIMTSVATYRYGGSRARRILSRGGGPTRTAAASGALASTGRAGV